MKIEKEFEFNKNKEKRMFVFFQMWKNYFSRLKEQQKANMLRSDAITQQNVEQKLLSQTFNHLIREKNLTDISKMTQAGYRPNIKQAEALAVHIKEEYFNPAYYFKMGREDKLIQHMDNGLYLPEPVRYEIFNILLKNEKSEPYMLLLGTDYSIRLTKEINEEIEMFKREDRVSRRHRFLLGDLNSNPSLLSSLAPYLNYIEKWVKNDPDFYIKVWNNFCKNVSLTYGEQSSLFSSHASHIVEMAKSLYENFIFPKWNSMNSEIRKEALSSFNKMLYRLNEEQKEKKSPYWANELEKLATLHTQINAITIVNNNVMTKPVNFNDILEKTRKMYGQNIQDTKPSYSFVENDLPLMAQNVLTKIKDSHTYLLQNIQYVDVAKRIWIESMLEKRIPEIIQKYMAFSATDREHLKNHDNKTPTDLCIDSFENIYSEFNDITQQVKQDHLSDFSAVNKYTRQFKH